MKYLAFPPALIALSAPALAHGDAVVHMHSHAYALWAIALGLVVAFALRQVRNRD